MTWDAKTYHQVSNPQFAWGQKVLERLPLAGDETVLDVGCGTGRLTALLAERLPRGRVIALDRDAGMIEQARAHLAPWRDRVELIVGDASSLPERDVDAVFSTATFHWVLDHDALFRSIFRALRPGGRLVAQCGGQGNLARVLGRLAGILEEPALAPYFAGVRPAWHFASADETAARLSRLGFVEVRTALVPAPTPFESREAFRTFATNVVLGQRLGPLKDERLKTEVIERVVEQHAHDEPPFVLDYVRLDIAGERSGR